MMHFGIDYGSKLAGTTVITYNIDGVLYQKSSKKKEDADAMIIKLVNEQMPRAIYIDAPLSLPKAYFGKGDDYFYRAADRELKAMSPMFLGGLTARAIKIKAFIESLQIEIFETYPGGLVRSIPELKQNYSKKDALMIPKILDQTKRLLGDVLIFEAPKNIHQIDSLLAWYSGLRHQKGRAKEFGDIEEGLVII